MDLTAFGAHSLDRAGWPLPSVPVASAAHAFASASGMAASGSHVRELVIHAADGFPLSATLYENPAAANGPLLLVSPAAAVPRSHYSAFARSACEAGFRAVLTYDYRGVAGSAAPRGWTARINMKDWGILDLPAAAAALQAVSPGSPMSAIGQSIGGVAFGLSGETDRFSRHAMVAAGHGWLGHTDEAFKLFVSLNLLARPISALIGHAPGWLGLGLSLPRSIIQDWARYTRSRDYICDDPSVPETARFSSVTTPTLALGFADDRWTTRRSLDALAAKYGAAPVSTAWIEPSAIGERSIGHMGFFRPRLAAKLWPPVLAWLAGAADSVRFPPR